MNRIFFLFLLQFASCNRHYSRRSDRKTRKKRNREVEVEEEEKDEDAKTKKKRANGENYVRLYNRKNDKDINALVDEYPHALYIFFSLFQEKKNIQYSFFCSYVRLNSASFTSVNNQNF